MSDAPLNPAPHIRSRRSAGFYVWSAIGSLVLLIVLVVVGLLIYSSTARFSGMVRKKVVAVLEDSTGGRVELQSIHWSLRRLSVSADNLTIHGLEGPGEMPYAHVDRLYVRIRILSFFKPGIALNYLEADHPVFHLIVYPDGSTNQPRPRHPASNRSLTDTIFDLEAGRTEVNHGLLWINQRAIPFNLTANNLRAVVTYSTAKDRYLGSVQVADLDLQRDSAAPLDSRLTLDVELSRTVATLKALHFVSGESKLDASGSIADYAHPQWKLAARGSVDLREVAPLTGVAGLRRGIANLAMKGQGSGSAQYSIHGNLRLTNAAFETSYLTVDGASATTQVSVTPEEIALTGLNARLRDGGSVDATVRFLHWSSPAAAAAAVSRQSPRRSGVKAAAVIPSASIRAYVRGIRLPAVMRMVASPRYRNLGFDTAAEGNVDVNWTDAGEDLTVAAKMRLRAPSRPVPGQLPLNGVLDAKYFERGGKVQIKQLDAQTPASQIQVTGTLAVYPVTAFSALQVHFATTKLAEFDPTLTDLGLAAKGKKGVAAIPVELDGEAEFTGAVGGSLIDPEIQGHLTATNFSTVFDLDHETSPAIEAGATASGKSAGKVEQAHAPLFPATTAPKAGVSKIHWDRLDATGEYSSALISIQHAMLTGGGTAIQAQGRLEAHRISARRHAFDSSSAIDVTASVHQASLTDLLAIAGQPMPISGTVNLQVHAGGSLDNLNGGGQLAIRGGDIEGEPYRSIAANLTFSGSRINLVNLRLLQDGGTMNAAGDYDLAAKTFMVKLDAGNFELADFQRLQKTGVPVTGSLKFDAQASGTLQGPSIVVGVHLANATVQGQPVGGLEVAAHTEGNVLVFTAQSSLKAAQLNLSGQTVLRDPFQTHAKLTVTGLDINPLLQMTKAPNLEVHSLISGTAELAGPAKDPKHLSGSVEVGQFSATVSNMKIGSEGPLIASIRDGVIHIVQAHIVGPETNLTISGSASAFGNRELDLNAGGSINVKLAETFNSDVTSSGRIDFSVQAAGSMRQPVLTGQVHLADVAMSLNDVPTGISKLNGTLIFDQDRLEVQNLTGITGGGQLKLGGFITYQNGIYANLTVTGKDVRVRYSGVSVTADTTLHLQGSEKRMLLSGNVQITRFMIGPTFDFAVFAGGPAAMVPPNPNAPSNRVQLDVHIASSPQLDFQNSYAQLAGSLDLRIRGTVAQPNILGQINITEGTANFAGTTYQLQHGSIYFTNPVRIDPVIDIDATTRIEEYDVTVGLNGSASHLSPTFRSDPPLPQADVISLLALGRTQQEQQLYSQEAEQAGTNPTTNALLGGALNAAVSSRVQRLFGVGSVKIDPTYVGNLGNSTARITVQQNISRNIQLTYATNVNTTAEQLIQAQVNLTQNVSVLTQRDEAGVFSMVLQVHRRAR